MAAAVAHLRPRPRPVGSPTPSNASSAERLPLPLRSTVSYASLAFQALACVGENRVLLWVSMEQLRAEV